MTNEEAKNELENLTGEIALKDAMNLENFSKWMDKEYKKETQ